MLPLVPGKAIATSCMSIRCQKPWRSRPSFVYNQLIDIQRFFLLVLLQFFLWKLSHSSDKTFCTAVIVEFEEQSLLFQIKKLTMNHSLLSNGSYAIVHQNATQNISNTGSQQAQTLAVFVAIIVTNALGSVANFLLLLAMIRCPPLRKSSNSPLIMHCIAIDLYTTLVAAPSVIIPFYLGPTYPLPESVCRYQALYMYTAFCAGMVASCVVALHRLMATILPRHFHILTKQLAIVFVILLPWIVTIVIYIFPTLQIGTKIVRSPTSGGCVVIALKSSSLLVSTIFGYYLPTALMGVSYVIVLGKTSFEVYRKKTSQSLRRRLEISRMLFVSFLWHCLTVYPSVIIMTFFLKELIANYQLQLAVKWLGNSFSAVNPVSNVSLCGSDSINYRQQNNRG